MFCRRRRNGDVFSRISPEASGRANAWAGGVAGLLLAGLCAAMAVSSCDEEPSTDSPHPVGREGAIAAALATFIRAHGEFDIGIESLSGKRSRIDDSGDWDFGEWMLVAEPDGYMAVHSLPGNKAVVVRLKREGEAYCVTGFEVGYDYWHK